MKKLFSVGSRLIPFRLSASRFHGQPPPSVDDWREKKLPHQTRRSPDLLLHKYILNKEKMNSEKWNSIREELLSKKLLKISPTNIDAIIMDTCCALDAHELGLDYCQYLRANDHKFNLATLGKYFKLLTRDNKELAKDTEEDILRLYSEFRREYPMMDPTTAEYCVVGLARTRNWRECLELIETIEETANPSNEALTSVICAAFRDNEPDIAWEYMRKVVSRSRLRLDRKVYDAYIDYSVRTTKSQEELEAEVGKMFEALADWDEYPWLSSMERFTEVLKKYGWHGRRTIIGMNGVCTNCGHQLPRMAMSDEDFEYLKKAVFDKTLVAENIYYKTTPKELNRFNRFIQAVKPFDIVVDGLNIEYSLCKTKSKNVTGGKLARLIEILVQQNKGVVVLGRKHMTNWVKTHFNFIQENSKLFMANNLSQDDPYLLYATFHGGPNTYFISKDLMRQHKFLLEDSKLKHLFKLWQMTHQIFPTIRGGLQQSAITLQYPPVFAPLSQQDSNGWHLPCLEEHQYHQPNMYDPSTPWYCFRRDSSSITVAKTSNPLKRLPPKGRLQNLAKR